VIFSGDFLSFLELNVWDVGLVFVCVCFLEWLMAVSFILFFFLVFLLP